MQRVSGWLPRREPSASARAPALAESQRVRSALLAQRGSIERAWGRIEAMSDQEAPGRLLLRTGLGYVLLFGLDGDDLWVEVLGGG
jgi:hypothetical protein